MIIEPGLAKDAIIDKVILPCGAQPKIDGVRALNLDGTLTGRSLDPFEGFGITDYFSKPEFVGKDGEMTLGDNPASPDRLCSLTTGAMGRFKDVTEMADLHWWLFDLLNESTIALPYEARYELLARRVEDLQHPRLHLVPLIVIRTKEQLRAVIAQHLDDGYEGTITRNLSALFKPGRPTQKGQELGRFKPWSDSEMLVTGITEGESNQNVAKKNTLGRTERSSAKAGKVPNGQVGSIQGTMLADFFNPVTGELMFAKGLPITIGSGKMTVVDAAYYFAHPEEIVGHIVKFKHMTHGVKDLPRMGGYISHRLKQDMS